MLFVGRVPKIIKNQCDVQKTFTPYLLPYIDLIVFTCVYISCCITRNSVEKPFTLEGPCSHLAAAVVVVRYKAAATFLIWGNIFFIQGSKSLQRFNVNVHGTKCCGFAPEISAVYNGKGQVDLILTNHNKSCFFCVEIDLRCT